LLRRGHKTQARSTMTAAAPRCAAASVTATAASAATVTAICTTTTTTSTAAAAAAHRYLREAAGAVFLVEDVECGQTHVGYFLFAKSQALIGCGVRDCGRSAVARADADALPTSERPSPAARRAGTPATLVRRFRFETCFTRDILRPPCASCRGWHNSDVG
jgi:hypothetical protein